MKFLPCYFYTWSICLVVINTTIYLSFLLFDRCGLVPFTFCLIISSIAFILIAWKKHKMKNATLPILNLPIQNFNNTTHNANMINGPKLLIVVVFLCLISVPGWLLPNNIIDSYFIITFNYFYIPSFFLPLSIIMWNQKYLRFLFSLC